MDTNRDGVISRDEIKAGKNIFFIYSLWYAWYYVRSRDWGVNKNCR